MSRNESATRHGSSRATSTRSAASTASGTSTYSTMTRHGSSHATGTRSHASIASGTPTCSTAPTSYPSNALYSTYAAAGTTYPTNAPVPNLGRAIAVNPAFGLGIRQGYASPAPVGWYDLNQYHTTAPLARCIRQSYEYPAQVTWFDPGISPSTESSVSTTWIERYATAPQPEAQDYYPSVTQEETNTVLCSSFPQLPNPTSGATGCGTAGKVEEAEWWSGEAGEVAALGCGGMGTRGQAALGCGAGGDVAGGHGDGWAKVSDEVYWDPKPTYKEEINTVLCSSFPQLPNPTSGVTGCDTAGKVKEAEWWSGEAGEVAALGCGGMGTRGQAVLGCDAGGHVAGGHGDGWAKVSSEVYWDPKPTYKEHSSMKQPMCSSLAEEEKSNVACQNCQRREEQVAELECLIKKMNKKKKMEKLHKIEMRAREKKEIGFVILVAICAIVYALVALVTRGFV